jgi:hypothetical protein
MATTARRNDAASETASRMTENRMAPAAERAEVV